MIAILALLALTVSLPCVFDAAGLPRQFQSIGV